MLNFIKNLREVIATTAILLPKQFKCIFSLDKCLDMGENIGTHHHLNSMFIIAHASRT